MFSVCLIIRCQQKRNHDERKTSPEMIQVLHEVELNSDD